MLLIAMILFIIVFPVLIPAAVEAVGAINDVRKRRRDRITYSLGEYAESVAG
jgi:ABC-type transport system involved in cytochrome c biogenesis permease component